MRRLVVAAVVALGLLGPPVTAAPTSAAWAAPAAWATTAAGSATARATTLAPAVNLSASCNLLLNASVTLSWGASASAWADGYEVRWGTTSGGPYPNSSGVVAGLSYSTPALGLGTHYFVVQAAKGAWRSTPTAQVSKSIVTVVLSLVCL